MQQALAAIVARFSIHEIDFFPSYPLSRLTTLRIGGPCTLLAVPKSEEVLLSLLSLLDEQGIPRVLLGNGSNILAPDEGYRGVVIRTSALRDLSVREGEIRAACGVPLFSLVQAANAEGVAGLSRLAGIPGTVGGALFMNAGAFSACMGDTVKTVRVVPANGGTPFTLTRRECDFSYRKSIFQARTLLILSALFSGEAAAPHLLTEESRQIMERRRAKQPLELPNAGSTFRRPAEGFAGRLIEESGLCGVSVGGATVSRKHAGFIVNTGGATAKDVRTLISMIQNEVYERTGIRLVREIEYLGE